MNSIIFKPRNTILILLIFSLGIYYKTINGEIFSLDDKWMVSYYNNNTLTIKQFFFSERIEHYYRPVVLSSFLIDHYIWMDHESGFHLTNVILHSINAILVYVLAVSLQPSAFSYRYLISFFAALLFAIHPINTEAVNFISGRTDILAAFFVLISLFLFLYYKHLAFSIQHSIFRYIVLILSVSSYFLAILSKEVALTFPFIVMVYEYFLGSFQPLNRERMKSAFRGLIIFTFPTAIYFYLRSIALSAGDISVGRTISIANKISPNFFLDITASVGFYLKKLIYPFPLNFAIVEINRELYFSIGTICLILLLISAIRHKLSAFNLQPSAFLLWSIFLSLLPSIAISLTDISWTPYAERYLYLPSVFLCIFSSFQLSAFSSESSSGQALQPSALKPIPILLIATIIIWFSIATYNRNIIWLSNLTMWEDTIKKSPKFGNAYNEYGVALIMKGENEKAKEQFLKGIELGHKTPPLFNLGYLAMRNNDFELAEDYFNKGLRIMPDTDAYRKLGSIYEEKAVKDNNREYLLKAIENYEKAYQLNRNDEFLALKLGGLYYRAGRYEDAKAILKKALSDNPDSYIEKPAKKILKKVNEKNKILSYDNP